MPRKAQPVLYTAYTMKSRVLLKLAVRVTRDGVMVVWTPWPGGVLARCCSLSAPISCTDPFDDLRRESWGIRRRRDAGALEIGGREGFRLDEAFFGAPRCGEPCSFEERCRGGSGARRDSRWGGAGLFGLRVLGVNPRASGSLESRSMD